MIECLTCKSLTGEAPLSPGPVIYSGQYWQVEHMYPTGLRGWLVIILKRHIEALHELSQDEATELAVIQTKFTKILRQELNTQKEYFLCFAEKEGFNHIHFHLVSILENLPEKYRGANIFSVNKEITVPEETIKELSEKLQRISNVEV